MAWGAIAGAVIGGAASIFSSGQQRGAKEKAGRTANAARVEAGKKQVRQTWRELAKQNEWDIETLNILINNT